VIVADEPNPFRTTATRDCDPRRGSSDLGFSKPLAGSQPELCVLDEEFIEQPAVPPVARSAEEYTRPVRLKPLGGYVPEVEMASGDVLKRALGEAYRTRDSTLDPGPRFVVASERLVEC